LFYNLAAHLFFKHIEISCEILGATGEESAGDPKSKWAGRGWASGAGQRLS
jgi:hypothetical protein